MSWQLTAATRHVGVIGDPIHHSLSPTLHNAAYRSLGVDLVFGAYLVREGNARQALHGARALDFVGLSVTTPHKAAIALAADQRTGRAERLGAANMVRFVAGISVADSTDGAGLLADLGRACGFEPQGSRCAVVGAGGAARAVVLALGEADAGQVLVVNRTASRAASAAELAGAVGRVGRPDDLSSVDLVVNATSIGLTADGGAALVDELAEPLHAGQLVVDLVYRPAVTPFLAAARNHGATVRNGLGMLVHQAALQVEQFTGLEAPIEAMWAAVTGEPTS